MKAKIEVLSKTVDGVEKDLFPLTVTEGVVDPETKKNAKELFEEKADHGYEENPKTLKEVDEEKALHGYSEEEEPKTLKQVETEKSAELDQLADDMNLFKEESNLKDAIQDSKIKDIESIISTMNPNQSAQLSVSGRKVVSLPKNAASGGMSVKLEGLTAENIVVNGDFRNGLSGWKTEGSGAPIIIENGYVKQGVQGQSFNNIGLRQAVESNNTDVYYVNALIKNESLSGSRYGIHATIGFALAPSVISINIPISQDWVNYSATFSGDFTTILIGTTSPSSGVSYIDNVKLINLTATFGAGNEPTKEQCDLIFSDYFEGVKSFVPTGRVRSVDKNGLNPTALYLTAPELRSIGLVKDEIRKGADGYELVKRVADAVPTVSFIDKSASEFVDILWLNIANKVWSSGENVIIILPDRVIDTYSPYTEGIDWTYYFGGVTTLTLRINVPKGHFANLAEANTYFSSGYVTHAVNIPEIIPISYGGVLNSAESGTVYHEPIIADAGVYDTKMDILLTDYPITTIVEIIKHENGIDTYLDVASAVVASDGLSFTHPDLADGDLVLFTYAFDKESTNGNITATFYDSNVVKIDTVTGKAYKIEDVITNGVLTRTLTEV